MVRVVLAGATLFTAGVLAVQTVGAEDQPGSTVTVTRTETVRHLQSRHVEGRGVRWWAGRAKKNRREIIRLRRAWRPTVNYAIGLACTIYRVPCSQMHSVASCESGHNPAATNGQYVGLFQEGPMFYRGPFGHLGSPFDPLLNALTAAYTVSREGWRQWECKP